MIHAFLGEAGALMFLWVLIEMLNPTDTRIRRATIASLLGITFLFGAWISGGFYYVFEYGPLVKPVIKAGPTPWAHAIATETKEHVFLFIPFLAILVHGLLKRYRTEFSQNRSTRVAVILLSASIVLMAFSMAGFGFIISSGFRAALEAKALGL